MIFFSSQPEKFKMKDLGKLHTVESTETLTQPDCQQESPEEDAVTIKAPVEPSIEPAGKDILQEAIKLSRALTDTEKLTLEQDISDEDLDVRYFGSTRGRKRKQISF